MKVETAIIGNRFTLTFSEPPTRVLLQQVRDEFTYPNPEFAQAVKRAQGKYTPKVPERLTSVLISSDFRSISVSRGSVARLLRVLGLNEAEFSVENLTTKGGLGLFNLKPTVTLRDYQEEQIQVALANPTCLWRAPPGSGKTTSALMLFARLKVQTVVIVPSEKIFEQWYDRAISELGMAKSNVGRIGGGEFSVAHLTIAMQQSLRTKIELVRDRFGLVIADEVQRHGAETFYGVTDKFSANYRLGVSGDERRADGKEFLVYDLFGPVRHEVKRDVLVEAGSLVEAKVVVVPSDMRLDWYENMSPRLRADTHVQQKLANDLSRDSARNLLIERLMGEFVDGGVPSLTLTTRIEHAQLLHARAVGLGGRAGLMLGARDREAKRQFEFALAAMKSGSMKSAVGTYQAVGVGFDLPALAGGVFAMPCANSQKGRMQFAQYVGRYERPSPGKTGATVFYVWDHRLFGANPLRNIASWKPNAVVLDGDREVPIRQYLKGWTPPTSSDDDDGIFR